MRREVRWERMFPDELDAALAERPLVYLPYGLCEPHGPQNALGMDALRPHAACCRAAREHGGIVAPPSYWHIHGYGIYSAWAHPIIGQQRHWLTPIPPWLFFKNLFYHVRAVDELGFHAAVLFTGHCGPHCEDMQPMVDILQPHVAVRIGFYHDFQLVPEEFKKGFSHAGNTETSYLWAAEPDCVDFSRLPKPDAPGPHFAMGPDARDADRRNGEKAVAGIAANLVAKAQAHLAEYDRAKPRRKPLTYDAVERIWDREVRPRLPKLGAMKALYPNQEPPPKDSQWFANWRVRGMRLSH